MKIGLFLFRMIRKRRRVTMSLQNRIEIYLKANQIAPTRFGRIVC